MKNSKNRANEDFSAAITSKAEIDLQLRDLEYKIGAADRKNLESFNELRDQGQDLYNKILDLKGASEDNDEQLLAEIKAFESQVEGRLLKQKHVSVDQIRNFIVTKQLFLHVFHS